MLDIDETVTATLEANIHFHHLPPTMLGAGCTTLPQKFHAVAHSFFLEAGETEESFASFHDETVAGTFDLGTGLALPQVLPVPSTTLFPRAFPQQRDDDLQQGEADEWLRPPEVEDNGKHHISLQSALAAPGLLHIIHNAGSDLVEMADGLGEAVTRLQHVSDLVRGKHTCERLIETCYSTEVGKCFHQQLRRFNGHVYRARRGATAYAVKSILGLERILRWGWNVEKYCSLGENRKPVKVSAELQIAQDALTSEYW